MLSWSYHPYSWHFDVTSLMVLVGEGEELNYRLSQRSLPEALAAAPVVGLQSYIRSYDFLADGTSRDYFSPFGCKSAPFRNPRLNSSITLRNLLEDGQYGVYLIRPTHRNSAYRRGRLLTWLWALFTWICFGGILAFVFLVNDMTWIGALNCIFLSGWSIVVKTIEHYQVRPTQPHEGSVTRPESPDAIYILGRKASAFIVEGTRKDVKNWTGQGLCYYGLWRLKPKGDSKTKDESIEYAISARICQAVTRTVTFFVMVFVFLTIPNGSTMDQTAFVLLNVLGQINVLVGRHLNTWMCLAELERVDEGPKSDEGQPIPVKTQTLLWALLLRKFQDVNRDSNDWVEAAGLLPQTDVWKEWRRRVVLLQDEDVDEKRVKDLYNEIFEEKMNQRMKVNPLGS